MSGRSSSRVTGGVVFAGVVIAAAAAIVSISGVGARAQGIGPFTQAQVTAGRENYRSYCASCHAADLGGAQDAPPLTGQNFNIDWSASTTQRFYQFVSTSMPEGIAGDLSSDIYYNIIAFILAANGAKPGPVPFDKNSNVKISDIANGEPVAAVVTGGGAPSPQN